MPPIVLDSDLHPDLFPLAWLIGQWRGTGAAQLDQAVSLPPDLAEQVAEARAAAAADSVSPEPEQPSPLGRRIEQELNFTALPSGVLEYSMSTWVLDAPPPGTPLDEFGSIAPAHTPSHGETTAETSTFVKEGTHHDPTDQPHRTLLATENGYWRVARPVPGAKSETEDGPLPHIIEIVLSHPEGNAEVYVGEVNGPRIQAQTDFIARTESGSAHTAATRMYGLVNGNLMWVLDQTTGDKPAGSYLSAELQRDS